MSRGDPRELARLRKARQRAKLRRDGFVKLEITVSAEVARSLTAAGQALGTSAKEEAQALLRHSVQKHRQSAENLARKAGQLWGQARPYLDYVGHLSKPGAVIRVRDKTLRQVDWQPLYEQLAQIYALFAARGWSRARVERFLSRSARKFSQ